jgi:hypothetical protein
MVLTAARLLRKTIEDIMDAATRQAFVSPVGPGDFLKPAGPAKDFRWILSERKKDWLGIDAVLYENGVAVLAIDLKTGCP